MIDSTENSFNKTSVHRGTPRIEINKTERKEQEQPNNPYIIEVFIVMGKKNVDLKLPPPPLGGIQHLLRYIPSLDN